MNWTPILTPLTKINLKWIKGLNAWPETVKILEEYTWEKFFDVDLGNDFFDMTPSVQTTKVGISKWHYIKLKSFCKGNNEKNEKATSGMRENICKPTLIREQSPKQSV